MDNNTTIIILIMLSYSFDDFIGNSKNCYKCHLNFCHSFQLTFRDLHYYFLPHLAQSLSHVQLCNPMECSLVASSVQGISQQEYWSDLSFPPQGDLFDLGIKAASPALSGKFFTAESPGKHVTITYFKNREFQRISKAHKASKEFSLVFLFLKFSRRLHQCIIYFQKLNIT